MPGLFALVIIPFLFSFIVPFLYKKFNNKIHTGWFVLIVPLVIFSSLIPYIADISSGKTVSESIAWMPSLGLNFSFYMDGLNLIFGLLISGIGTLVVVYSIYYLDKDKESLHNFYIYLLLFMGAMLGVVFSDHVFLLYVFWELTSISSFLLIAYWYQREKSRAGALKSLLITVFGGLAMLGGFILLSLAGGTYRITELIGAGGDLSGHPFFLPAMILILLGAFTKSAQFPFSIWLPDAMEAPTPISAYLHSATMVKAGIYLVARLTPVFGGSAEWFWIVSGVGLLTLLYGSVNAVRQYDLKALLAYSTVSQLGLIMSLLGIGSAALYFGYGDESVVYATAVFAAIFHLVNHSTFKGSLFMIIGIIDHETGSRDIRRLGGLMHIMPVSFTIAVISSFSMAGLPPFNGFLSKEMFFNAVVLIRDLPAFNMDTFGVLFPVVAWIASVFTFIYSMIIVFKTFAGKYEEERFIKPPAHEAPFGMLIPPIILALFVVGIFFFPNGLGRTLLEPAWHAVLPSLAGTGELHYTIAAWHGWTTELAMTIGVVAAGIILYLTLKRWRSLYLYYPQRFTLNSIYYWLLGKMESVSYKITEKYMTGSARHYMIYIFAFFIIVMGVSLFASGGFTIDLSNDAPVNFYELVIIIAMILSALTVLFSKSRITSIIAVSAVGFFIVFLFVFFRAPDLALTQLVVETVSTVLFLLVFYHLPKLKKEITRVRFKAVNAVIAVASGLVVTLVALAANGTRLFPSISKYFEDSYELAGARNIVNAILVDFRGFDTMLEITVLTIAGLGVYALIKLRLAGRDKDENSG